MHHKRIALLLAALLLVPSLASAQDQPEEEPVGSVSASETMTFQPSAHNAGNVHADQMGLSGEAEALINLTWYGYVWPMERMVATATSRLISGNPLNACAQIIQLRRASNVVASTGQVCQQIGPGNTVVATPTYNGSWCNAHWFAESWHQFGAYGIRYWAPILSTSVTL